MDKTGNEASFGELHPGRLNGVVYRFSREVQTKRLEKLVDFTIVDYARIDKNMSKASTWLSGHDMPAAVNEPMPPLDDLLVDLKDLEDYIKELKLRKKQGRTSVL